MVSLDSWQGHEASADVVGTSGRQMHLLPALLSHEEVAALHDAASRSNSFDSSEPDTVDKEATFSMNVLEDGESMPAAAEVAAIIAPIIEERLLPYVRAKFGCADACIGDVLLRRYRPGERTTLNLHYDIQAFATAIIPLSTQRDAACGSPSAGYTGGLFVQGGASASSRRLVRFPALGDVLVHQFDLMHGVEVESGARYALAVWFYGSHACLEPRTKSRRICANTRAPCVNRLAAVAPTRRGAVGGAGGRGGQRGRAVSAGDLLRAGALRQRARRRRGRAVAPRGRGAGPRRQPARARAPRVGARR